MNTIFKASLLTILLILILFSNLSAQTLISQAQRIEFDHISVEQGLSRGVVFSILQDRKGFKWFGTADGLNKYDGYNFTVYKPDPENPHSVGHNVIWTLYEDRTGVLWIGTVGSGLNKFDRDTARFTHYKHDPNDPRSLSHNDVRTIYEARD